MTSRETPERRDEPGVGDRNDTRRKLAITLAALALVLTILLVVFFGWWQREGEETDEDAVQRIELVERAQSHGDFLAAAS